MSIFLAVRADFGLGNPNLAGALFAMLAVAVWGVWRGRTVKINPKVTNQDHRFWICLGLSVFFSGLMILTASRGAVVALGAGLLASWGAAGCPRLRLSQVGGVVAAMLALGMWAGLGRMGERVAESSTEDGSITCRIEIFKTLPAMLTAAPHGWGRGESAEAYQNWFQDLEDARTYKHLLSTHATWMVERGWGFRMLYVVGWAAVLILCGEAPVCLGVWVVYGTAGIFSHVGGDWRLGVLPALALGVAVWRRVLGPGWPQVRAWRRGMFASGVVLVVLTGIGAVTNRGISRTADGVEVGGGSSNVWFFAPDVAVLGKSYGKVVRSRGVAGVSWNFETVDQADREGRLEIVLSGSAPIRADDRLSVPYAVTWLNPPGRLIAAQERFLKCAVQKTILWGELRTDANPGKLRAWVEELPDARWVFVRGQGRFLGDGF